MTPRALLGVFAAPLLLGACEHPLDGPLSTSFGRAVASMDVQIVPAPVSSAPPEGSGALGAAAIRRYETRNVLGANAVSAVTAIEPSSAQPTPTPATRLGAAP